MNNLLNIGCGSRYHSAWRNTDLRPVSDEVEMVDFRLEFPFKSGSFKAVYSSHVLEHFTMEDASQFLRECARILEPDGILRIAVPNLEAIARTYLEEFDSATRGDIGAIERHSWMIIELYDQTVRRKPGGAMLELLQSFPRTGNEFIRSRIGTEAEAIWSKRENDKIPATSTQNESESWKRRLSAKIKNRLLKQWFGTTEKEIQSAIQAQRFMNSGEIHKWMYDRISLEAALSDAGLTDILVVSATTSNIPQWRSFELDANSHGLPHKPDSLYMEASKP